MKAEHEIYASHSLAIIGEGYIAWKCKYDISRKFVMMIFLMI